MHVLCQRGTREIPGLTLSDCNDLHSRWARRCAHARI